MRDKSMSLFVIFFFGVSGLALVALAWFQPAAVSDKIAATLAGAVGLAVALVRALTLRHPEDGRERAAVKVEPKDSQ